jgi:2-polyprenyl-3-methyl-5-hydroxy-6-metoxy-1,4-benzoquinol methylase
MAIVALNELFACPRCKEDLSLIGETIVCRNCQLLLKLVNGIPRFVTSKLHDNFGIQWNTFSKIQLDSFNGSTESRDRLLAQSGLSPDFFFQKTILEVGSGAGRFTEVLLGLGARVVSVDYSSAVDANAETNRVALQEGRLCIAQADIFALPLKPRAFDVVLCYGVIQHTGDNVRAIECLWNHVKPGGLLLIDCYQLSFRHTLPIKYLLRPIMKRLPPLTTLKCASLLCRLLVPIQKKLLRKLGSNGTTSKRYLRYLVNRSPNSVYPINLWVMDKIGEEVVLAWSILDTFDQWSPVYDQPVTFRKWEQGIRRFTEMNGGTVVGIASAGHGNVAILRRSAI